MSEVLKGVIGSLIAASLIAGGSWLAVTQTYEKTVLHYSQISKTVGETTVWYIYLSNNSEFAFDKVIFNSPKEKLIKASFEPPCKEPNLNASNPSTWKGQLLVNSSIKALFLFDTNEMLFSIEKLRGLLKVEYQVRDEESGALKWQKAPIQEGSAPTISRTVAAVLWFLAPFAAAGVIIFGGRYIVNRVRQPSSAAN